MLIRRFYKKRINDLNLKSNISAKISGGEAQRLGLARALYQEPELLIMDESTNAIDKINEKNSPTYLFITWNNIDFYST